MTEADLAVTHVTKFIVAHEDGRWTLKVCGTGAALLCNDDREPLIGLVLALARTRPVALSVFDEHGNEESTRVYVNCAQRVGPPSCDAEINEDDR